MNKRFPILVVAFALSVLALAVPLSTAGQSQALVREKLGEIGAWAVPSSSAQTGVVKPVSGQSQQALVREKLGEIGAWAVPASSTVAVASSGDRFQWNDAGIGAVFAFGIMLVGATCVVTIRRWHGPVAH